VKLMVNNPRNQQAKMNYEHLCDLHILLWLVVFYFYWNLCMFLLSLDKWGLCLCVTLWLLSRFVKVIYATHVLSRQSFNFIIKPFWAFKLLLECMHENIQMKWTPNLNFGVQHFAFEVNGQCIENWRPWCLPL
jgi:hypothetical protein